MLKFSGPLSTTAVVVTVKYAPIETVPELAGVSNVSAIIPCTCCTTTSPEPPGMVRVPAADKFILLVPTTCKSIKLPAYPDTSFTAMLVPPIDPTNLPVVLPSNGPPPTDKVPQFARALPVQFAAAGALAIRSAAVWVVIPLKVLAPFKSGIVAPLVPVFTVDAVPNETELRVELAGRFTATLNTGAALKVCARVQMFAVLSNGTVAPLVPVLAVAAVPGVNGVPNPPEPLLVKACPLLPSAARDSVHEPLPVIGLEPVTVIWFAVPASPTLVTVPKPPLEEPPGGVYWAKYTTSQHQS